MPGNAGVGLYLVLKVESMGGRTPRDVGAATVVVALLRCCRISIRLNSPRLENLPCHYDPDSWVKAAARKRISIS